MTGDLANHGMVRRRALAARALLAVAVASVGLLAPVRAFVAEVRAAGTTTFCVEGLYSFYITSSGQPGEVQDFRLTSNPTGFISFATTVNGPFSDPLTLQITIGSAGTGQTPFIARGLAVGATRLDAIRVQDGVATNELDIVIDRVASIELQPKDAGHSLDADPHASETGAMRYFPDQDTPSADAAQSRSLKVIATLDAGSTDVPVDFRFADVDDPSSDTTPVDANGPQGGDNRGTTQLSSLSARTDANGQATVEVRLPMQPGDNLKLLASCVPGYANTLSLDGSGVKDGFGRRLPTPAAEISSLVTTWRRVWIETDSMAPVANNYVQGVVGSARDTKVRILGVRVPVTEIKLASMADAFGNPLDPRKFPTDQFQAGRIEVNGIAYQVLGSLRSSIYIAPGNAANVQTGTYLMVDDDDLNARLNGDDGYDVPLPDMAHLQSSDLDTENWFAQAFIRPQQLSGHDDVPFLVNGSAESSAMYCKVSDRPCPAGQNSFDNIATEASSSYWTAYLLGAYQPDAASDGDPTPEKRVGGRADTVGLGAAVFAETIREAGGSPETCTPGGVAVHELAHVFGATHTTGIMADECSNGTPTFAPDSLAQIRAALHP